MIVECLSCGKQFELKQSLYRFPVDIERCNKWANLIGRPDLIDLPTGVCHRNYGLCDNHFLPKDFDGGNTLRNDVDPSIFGCLGEAFMDDVDQSIFGCIIEAFMDDDDNDEGQSWTSSARLSTLLIAEHIMESSKLSFTAQLKELEENQNRERRRDCEN